MRELLITVDGEPLIVSFDPFDEPEIRRRGDPKAMADRSCTVHVRAHGLGGVDFPIEVKVENR